MEVNLKKGDAVVRIIDSPKKLEEWTSQTLIESRGW